MAAVAQSAVTILDTWTLGGMASKKRKVIRASIVLSAQGAAGNPIPASLLGLSVIESAIPFVYPTNQVGFLVPDSTGANANVAAISGGALTLTDITGTITVTVTGY